MAHVAQVTLFTLEWGQGHGSEGPLFLMELAHKLSAPAKWPDRGPGLWGPLQSLGRSGRRSLASVGCSPAGPSRDFGSLRGTGTVPVLASKLIFSFPVWFSVYEVSPTPPITVTHKPEEDTFGVSHFLVKRRSPSDFP